MSSFRIGQKVVCVDDEWDKNHRLVLSIPGMRFPKRGHIYTVREFFVDPTGGVSLRLVELVNVVVQYAEGTFEPGWGCRRFRPVVDRKTDISIFTDLLKTSKQKVPA